MQDMMSGLVTLVVISIRKWAFIIALTARSSGISGKIPFYELIQLQEWTGHATLRKAGFNASATCCFQFTEMYAYVVRVKWRRQNAVVHTHTEMHSDVMSIIEVEYSLSLTPFCSSCKLELKESHVSKKGRVIKDMRIMVRRSLKNNDQSFAQDCKF